MSNVYQKRFHKEIKRYATLNNIKYTTSKKILNNGKKFSFFSPCEDCDNSYCNLRKNKIVFCEYRR